MPPDELQRALSLADASGLDRFEAEVALEVGGERFGRGITLGGVDREGLREDRIEVAVQGAREPRRRESADRGRVFGVDAGRRPWRIARRSEDLEKPRRPGGRIERAPAGEELVEQQRERVDVGGE